MMSSLSLLIMVAMYVVSGKEYTSTVDTKVICDKAGECKYMVEKMKDMRKKFSPLPSWTYRTYKNYLKKLLEKPRWPLFVERGDLWSKFKRGATWTRL